MGKLVLAVFAVALMSPGVRTKVGIVICYDIQHPESVRELALGGAEEVVFVPYCTSDFSRPNA
jgi:predicted amidohydrolase